MTSFRSDGIASQIKVILTAEEVVRHYGFEVGRGGYMPCPFHREKTGSLKVYPGTKGWHCFGCGRGGTVIDFVMALLDLTFPQAVLRLNEDFRLGLTNRQPTRSEVSARMRARAEELRELTAYRQTYDSITERHRRLWYAYVHEAPQKPGDAINDEYAEACCWLPYLAYWLDGHPGR